jgi:ParB-like chromosome segregation protein Spo0J
VSLTAHPLADVFPVMSEDEFTSLVADIRAHGLLEPIVMFEGQILDGRHRHRACTEIGIEPRFETYEGDAPLAYIVSRNLKRRHLNESQRAMVAARITNINRESNLKQGARTADRRFGEVSIDEAAQTLGVSSRSVERANRVRAKAPELAEAVEAGEMKVWAAEQRIREKEKAASPGRGKRDQSKPYEITSRRHEQIANKAYERFSTAMGGLEGYCEGLSDFDVSPVLAVARPDEIEAWDRVLTDLARMTRAVQGRLRKTVEKGA